MPTNFLPRPSSRPTSPCGKRRHSGTDRHARSPSPHHSPTPGASPLGSVTDDTWAGSPGGALGSLLMSGYQELDVPSKTRRTLGAQLGLLAGQGDPGLEPLLDSPGVEAQEPDDLADLFLQVPSHFSWNKPKPGNPPLFRSVSFHKVHLVNSFSAETIQTKWNILDSDSHIYWLSTKLQPGAG